MRTILTFTNNLVRYALFPSAWRGAAERLIIDIRCDSGKMNAAVTPVRLTNDLCALHHTVYLLETLSSDGIIAETL